jgi:aminopeptidase N
MQTGAAGWRRAIRTYLERHRGKTVETADLFEAIRSVTGRDLTRFADQWIYRAGHPDYKIHVGWDGRRVSLWVVQKQAVNDGKALFEFPAEFRFRVGKRWISKRETIQEKEHTFHYPLPARPDAVLFDPEYHLALKTVDWEKSPDLWRAQLREDPNLAGRIEAAKGSEKWKTAEAADLLAAAFDRERHWGPKGEMALALGRMGTERAQDLLEARVAVRDPKVRRAVAQALGEIGDDDSVPHLERMAQRDPSIHVRSASLAALGKCGGRRALPVLERASKVSSWGEVVRQGALEGRVAVEGSRALGLLRKQLDRKNPYPVRAAAAHWMARLGKGERWVAEVLTALLDDSDGRVPPMAVRALGMLRDPSVLPELRKRRGSVVNSMLKADLDRAILDIRAGLPDS